MKNKLLVLFLTIAMTITILPLSVFAEEPATTGDEIIYITGDEEPDIAISDIRDADGEEPEFGSQDNPYDMDYYHKNYTGYGTLYEGKTMWFKMDVKGATKLRFSMDVEENDGVRNVELLDSDLNKVYSFDYNDEMNRYETPMLDLEKKTYYFRVRFSKAEEQSICIYSSSKDEDFEYKGTLQDPIVMEYDEFEEYEQYYIEDFYMTADTKELYYQIDSGKTDYYNLDVYCINEVKIGKVELLDSNHNNIVDFEAVESSCTDPDCYQSFSIDNYKLIKDARYYIKLTIDKPVENREISVNVYRLDGNGQQDNPYPVIFNESEYGDSYYSYGGEYHSGKEMWFKAEIQKDAKIRPYVVSAPYTDEDEDNGRDNVMLIDSAAIYLNGEASETNLVRNTWAEELLGYECDSYWLEDYISVKAGDVVLIKVIVNDNIQRYDEMCIELECFGITDKDVIVETSSYDNTWTGKAIEPEVTGIKRLDYELVAGKDYIESYEYEDNVNMGYGSIQITGNGDYPGIRWAMFKINPKGTTLKTVKAGKRSMTVNWKMQDKKMSEYRITGYQIQYSTTSDFTDDTTKSVRVKGYKKTSRTIKKLKKGKKYYVRVRTYFIEKDYGDKLYSNWSKTKAVKAN